MSPKKKVLICHILAGTLFGYLLLHPLTMAIYSMEVDSGPYETMAVLSKAIYHRILLAFTPQMNMMSSIFTLIGGLGGLGSGLYRNFILRQDNLPRLLDDKEGERKEVLLLIRSDESELLEFKSSLRWDTKKGCTNKELEKVILKTIAGFMNAHGGTLIIGVDDHGAVIGLKQDYQTLKRKNRDGFEQQLIKIISANIGTDFCPHTHVKFHEIDGKDVCQCMIDSVEQPAYVRDGNDFHYFVRTGNATRELNTKEAVDYIFKKQNSSGVCLDPKCGMR